MLVGPQPSPTFCQGAEINPKNPKASNYEDVAHALILRAASEYGCFISTDDTFPDTAKHNKWAKKFGRVPVLQRMRATRSQMP